MLHSTTAREPTLPWNTQLLWQLLDPLLPGLAIEVVATVASTNTALLDRARVVHGPSEVDGGNVVLRRSQESAAFGRRAADVQPSLLVAEHQSGGRGRQGRSWQSQVGASLTFSLGLPLAVSDWSGLSLAVGVALAEAIGAGRGPETAPRIGLKWPNDIWLTDDGIDTGRKLGGVLIETVAAGAKRLVVVGVGLNVLPFRADDLSSGFASAQELDPQVSAPALLARVAPPLVRSLLQFEARGFAAFADRFGALDLLRGRPVRTVQRPRLQGIACGVSAHGELMLRNEDGLHSISTGEVSVRLDDGDAGTTAPGVMC